MYGGSKYIIPGAIEPIEIQLFDTYAHPLTGITNLSVQIRRHADDFYLDWADNTFKPGSTCLQMYQTLGEVSAMFSPGIYRLHTAPHLRGFHTALITNPGSGDIYSITLSQQGDHDAIGLPTGYELHCYDLAQGLPAAVADAVWNEMQSDHRVQGSFGELMHRIVALQKENYYIDNMTYNAQGLLLQGRIRLFYTKTEAEAATPGGASEGEFAVYHFTTTETTGHTERAATARSVKEP